MRHILLSALVFFTGCGVQWITSLSVMSNINSQIIKSKFLSSILKIDATNRIADRKIVDPILEELIASQPFDFEKAIRNNLTQPTGTRWKIIWAPHINLLESFIFWNTFLKTNFTVFYNFGEDGEIITNAKFELTFLNYPPFSMGFLNTKGQYCMVEDGLNCKIVFDRVWLDFEAEKVSDLLFNLGNSQ